MSCYKNIHNNFGVILQYKKEDLILYVLYVFPTSLWNKPLFSIVTDLMYRKQIGMTNIYYIV